MAEIDDKMVGSVAPESEKGCSGCGCHPEVDRMTAAENRMTLHENRMTDIEERLSAVERRLAGYGRAIRGQSESNSLDGYRFGKE